MMTLSKTHTRWLTILFIVTLLPIWMPLQSAHACFCGPDYSLTEEERAVIELEKSSIAFIGTPIFDRIVGDDQIYTFVVDTVYKGSVGKITTVSTSKYDCGFLFSNGVPYTVYIDGSDVTWLCNDNVAYPSDDLRSALGEGYAPQMQIVVALFLIIGLATFLLRRGLQARSA